MPTSDARPSLRFWLAGDPPTTTHHAKTIAKRGDHLSLRDTPRLNAAKALIAMRLAPFRPPSPIRGPVRLSILWRFPLTKALERERVRAKGQRAFAPVFCSKPDLSNAMKTLEDQLVVGGFIEDDKNVVEASLAKVYSEVPGILVVIESVVGVG